MVKNLTLSVIVPIYNIEKFLPCCIDSVLAQKFTDWELILVDDGSKDSSSSICDAYAAKDDRIRVIHKSNGGLTSARNAGLAIASGEWIMHLDGDDWVEPDMLDVLLRKAEVTDSEIVFGDIEFNYPDHAENYQVSTWDGNQKESLNKYIASVWTCLCGGIAKKSLYQKHQ